MPSPDLLYDPSNAIRCSPAKIDLFIAGGAGLGKRGQGARFTEPMECLPFENIPEGEFWTYELLCGGPHKISSVVKVIMWCWIILAATFASEVVLQRNIIGNLLNTLNSATHNSPILPVSTLDGCPTRKAISSFRVLPRCCPGAFGVLRFSVFQRGRCHYRDIRRHSIEPFIGAHARVSAGIGEHRV
jgi:hypothetical protein